MFEAPAAPSLDLIDPNNVYQSATAYDLKPNLATSFDTMPRNAMYAAMGISAISSVITAIGSARAAKMQGDYEASIAATNARIARLQASQVLEAGDAEVSKELTKTSQTVGAVRAVQGASGTDVGKGSNVIVRGAIQEMGAMDALTIKNNAARQAWGLETEALQDTFKGQYAKLTAGVKAQQTILTGGLQAVSGPLGIESNYMRWSRSLRGGGADRLPFNTVT